MPREMQKIRRLRGGEEGGVPQAGRGAGKKRGELRQDCIAEEDGQDGAGGKEALPVMEGEKKISMMSLFDGSGGFPLAASLCGIIPKYASEVEPYPIAVTRSRFPDMIHLGDVCSINGGEIEPVDIITFGSPCQDMSVAGKRAGLRHQEHGDEETTRSGLFYEAVRIIREMREGTNGLYPAFVVWENVPGAFSSNKGEDFRSVLQALIEIVEPGAVMPPVPKKGWAYADCYCGDGWSLAYRTFDAQYWGVPQRRRRIYLVLDLRGQRAGKILFERQGLQGDSGQSITERERIARNSESGHIGYDKFGKCAGFNGYKSVSGDIQFTYEIGATLEANMPGNVVCLQGNMIDRRVQQNGSGITESGTMFTLNATDRHGVCCASFCAGAGSKANGIGWKEEQSPTLRSSGGLCMMPTVICRAHANTNAETYINKSPTITATHDGPPIVFESHSQDARYKAQGDTSPACTAQWGTGGNNMQLVAFAQNQRNEVRDLHDKATALASESGMKQQTFVAKPALTPWDNQSRRVYSGNGSFPALAARENAGGNQQSVLTKTPLRWIIRRLTPTECARMQGFPDWWGEVKYIGADDPSVAFFREVYRLDCRIKGKKITGGIIGSTERIAQWHNRLHTDSAEYKMWGNGIALPNALYVMQGIAEAMEGGD